MRQSNDEQGRKSTVGRWAVLAALIVLAIVGAIALWPQRETAPTAPTASSPGAAASPAPGATSGATTAAAGVAPAGGAPAAAPAPAPVDGDEGYGVFPAIDAQATPASRGVAAALAAGTHPERLSALVAPTPFDAAAYARDPAAYCAVSEPGRAFASAAAGPGVPILQRVGSPGVVVGQGATATLAVRTLPGQPASFTTFDGGLFDNQCTAITVQADAEGVARARFIATSGTIADVNILAASPVCAGQLRFKVVVTDANHPFTPGTAAAMPSPPAPAPPGAGGG